MTKKIQNRRIRSVAGVLVALGAATLAVACGGDGDDSGGTGGMNNTDLGDGISTDGSTTGNPDFDSSEGGKVDLDAEDIQAIEEASCTGWAAEGENLPATLQLVVDVSLSMNRPAPGSDRSKWEVTREALSQAIEELPASVAVGVLYYPNGGVRFSAEPQPLDACVHVDEMVAIQQLGEADSDQRDALEESLRAAQVDGYTPTHDAYKYALNEGLVPYSGSGNQKFMLLITDGAPTMSEGCVSGSNREGDVRDMPTQPIVDEIAGAHDQSIRTFLIGSPGSEMSSEETAGGDMRPWLSRAAVEGGTAADGCDVDGPNFCHMDMTQEPDFAEALRAGLAAIAGQVVDSCTFAVPQPPNDETIDRSLTNLVVTWDDGSASLYLPDNVGDCNTGWTFNDEGQVELCPSTCDEVKLDAGATVQLTFGCGTDVIDVVTK